ncbi:MAG: hypothetical protein KIT73_10260 [Burkholderiales bacterium]|nr:hypothetical protein [Burkholderiales bacterium]
MKTVNALETEAVPNAVADRIEDMVAVEAIEKQIKVSIALFQIAFTSSIEMVRNTPAPVCYALDFLFQRPLTDAVAIRMCIAQVRAACAAHPEAVKAWSLPVQLAFEHMMRDADFLFQQPSVVNVEPMRETVQKIERAFFLLESALEDFDERGPVWLRSAIARGTYRQAQRMLKTYVVEARLAARNDTDPLWSLQDIIVQTAFSHY